MSLGSDESENEINSNGCPLVRQLFRGVSIEMHESGQALSPKGTGFKRTMNFDDDWSFDTGCTFDDSRENAVIGHQRDSDYYRSAGVSTTLHFERAKYYATSGLTRDGFVYKISRFSLRKYGVQEHVVSEYTPSPKCPEDDEVILFHTEDGPLPPAIVSAVISVQP